VHNAQSEIQAQNADGKDVEPARLLGRKVKRERNPLSANRLMNKTLKIERVNLVDQAYRAIRTMIVSGALRPGHQLKMEQLTQTLGVSNSPVREAFRRLEQEGWVETFPHRGSFVRGFDAGQLVEIYELRAMIEVGVLRKVMPTLTSEKLAVLQAANDAIQKALAEGDREGFLANDIRFHQTLVDFAQNRRVSELFATIAEQGKCFVLGRGDQAMKIQAERNDEEHEVLLALIRGGETTKAIEMLERHVLVSLEQARELEEANTE
jgi:DNA-binding GntR family transcriptional regulator